jgi:surfeit locus 1 family protein
MRSWLFHLLVLVMLGTLLALGTWQMHRREWKQTLLQTLEQRAAMPPAALPAAAGDDWHWRTVQVTGRLLQNPEIRMDRYAPEWVPAKQWGHEIWRPLETKTGTYWLRLGWQPSGDGNKAISQTHWLVVVHPFSPPALGAPQNNPAQNLWRRADADMYRAYGFAPRDFSLDAVEAPFGITPLWQKPDLPNNHLQYAITWYALAFVLGVMYLYRIKQGQ